MDFRNPARNPGTRLGVIRNGARKLAKGIEGTFRRNSAASGLMVDAWLGVNEKHILGFDEEEEVGGTWLLECLQGVLDD